MPSDGAGPESRRSRLAAEAPAEAKGVWARFGDRVYLCGTLGAAFDAWQRRLAALSGADAFFSQQIGLDLVEREMDRLEEEARTSLDDGETLLPRKSPGYGDMPLSLSRDEAHRRRRDCVRPARPLQERHRRLRDTRTAGRANIV